MIKNPKLPLGIPIKLSPKMRNSMEAEIARLNATTYEDWNLSNFIRFLISDYFHRHGIPYSPEPAQCKGNPPSLSGDKFMVKLNSRLMEDLNNYAKSRGMFRVAVVRQALIAFLNTKGV